MSLDRRQFLRRSGAGAASVSAGLLGAAGAADAQSRRATLQSDGPQQLNPVAGPAARLPAVPFHGTHQAGILTTPPPAACFAAFDVVAQHRHELRELLRTLTAEARFLTAGGTPPNLGTGAPPARAGAVTIEDDGGAAHAILDYLVERDLA